MTRPRPLYMTTLMSEQIRGISEWNVLRLIYFSFMRYYEKGIINALIQG